MLRKNQKTSLAKQKIAVLIKQTRFSRDIIPDITKLVRSKPKEIIEPYISSSLKTMECIKWLILMHNLVFYQSRTNQTQIEQLLQLIKPLSESSDVFETTLLQKMIKPYRAYILKRNRFELKEVDPQCHCFLLINLLKSALCFTNILFTLGRYLFKQHNFLVEFNLIMAKDLAYVYRTLKMKITEDFKNQNIEVIEYLNEAMLCVYYNCYFNKYVCHLAPYWISLDETKAQSTPQLRSKHQILSKNQIRTEREVEMERDQNTIDLDVSIAIQQSSMNLMNNEQLKSASTIASHRESDFVYGKNSIKKQKQYREIKEFIQLAQNILQSFQTIQEENNS